MTGDTNELAHSLLTRAWEVYEDAKMLIASERWLSATNRLYYACFYAVSALLETEGIESGSHKGAQAMFGKHCVKTGLIARETAYVFNSSLI